MIEPSEEEHNTDNNRSLVMGAWTHKHTSTQTHTTDLALGRPRCQDSRSQDVRGLKQK